MCFSVVDLFLIFVPPRTKWRTNDAKAVVIIVARYWSATRVPHELFTIHSDLQVPLSQIVDSLLRESRHADIPDTVLLPEGIPPSCQHRENVHTVSGSPNLFYTTRVIIFFSLSILRKQC